MRRGAARGLEQFLRRNARAWKPDTASLGAARRGVASNTDPDLRLLLLLALTAAADRDSTTVQLVLRDPDPEVRRAAVALGRAWIDDTHPMVRWQALRVAPTCERATTHLHDSSEHVVLLLLDLLGERRCDAAPLAPYLTSRTHWRPRAHATVSLARLAPAEALPAIRSLAGSSTWQARAWAAQAAKLARDSATLRALARDRHPNVIVAAMTTHAEASPR